MNRVAIVASEGKILTNGAVYGTKIYLGDGVKEADFYEITREEYEARLINQSIMSQEV